MAKKLFQKRKLIIAMPLSVLGIFLAVHFSAECSKGILNGISFSVQVLIPSLFIFMIVAAYIVRSGAADAVSVLFRRFSWAVFRLPPRCLTALILAMIGGYPVGARCVMSLYEKGSVTASQAKKTSLFAVCAGPGFIVNFIGCALLNSKKSGFILLFSQLFAVVITAVIAGRTVRCERDEPKETLSASPAGDLLVASVADASSAVAGMCAMVVLFSALIEVTASLFSDYARFSALLAAFLEVTTGCNLLCGRYPLYLVAFFVGFGGLSVHFQIFSTLRTLDIQKGLFFLFRIIEGIITATVTYILVGIIPVETPVFSGTFEPVNAASSSTLLASGALILSCLCFLSSLKKQTAS